MRWYIDSTWQSRGFTVVVQEAGHGSSMNSIYIANHLARNDT
jgi:hypothetical protein